MKPARGPLRDFGHHIEDMESSLQEPRLREPTMREIAQSGPAQVIPWEMVMVLVVVVVIVELRLFFRVFGYPINFVVALVRSLL